MVSPTRVKDGSAMNDESSRDIELVLITPNPTRLHKLINGWNNHIAFMCCSL